MNKKYISNTYMQYMKNYFKEYIDNLISIDITE